jgi:hypothetical protein
MRQNFRLIIHNLAFNTQKISLKEGQTITESFIA